MEFFVTSKKTWIQNPDRKFGGWRAKTYVVVCNGVVRIFADNVRESFHTSQSISELLFPEFFTGRYETFIFTGMVE